jgi:hypothetical protein
VQIRCSWLCVPDNGSISKRLFRREVSCRYNTLSLAVPHVMQEAGISGIGWLVIGAYVILR